MESWLPWALATGGLGSLWLVRTWRDARRRRAWAKRRERGREGEREAEAWLEDAGYEIRQRQPVGALVYELDGRPVNVEVRGDLLVQRGRRTYLVEVKTGSRAPELRERATRRQLLEYGHAFEVDGLLLFDADTLALHDVGIPSRGAPRRPGGAIAVCLALVIGAGCGWFAASYHRAPVSAQRATAGPDGASSHRRRVSSAAPSPDAR